MGITVKKKAKSKIEPEVPEVPEAEKAFILPPEPEGEPLFQETLPDTFYLRCESCGEVFHQTTNKFDPTKVINAPMLKLIKRYGPSGENWEAFPPDPSISGDCLTCPGCYAPYQSIRQNLFMDRACTLRVAVLPLEKS